MKSVLGILVMCLLGIAYATAEKRQMTACVYHDGRRFAQGETWFDGCDYECQCINATISRFSCHSRCPIYPSLPTGCVLVTPPGECCGTPNCTTTFGSGHEGHSHQTIIFRVTPASGSTTVSSAECVDTTDCSIYDRSMCLDPTYEQWAIRICPVFCNRCDSRPTEAVQCQDSVNCQSYGESVCQNPAYEPWVLQNCPAFCNRCGDVSATQAPPLTTHVHTHTYVVSNSGPITTAVCQDRIDCSAYDRQEICNDPQFDRWARNNCASFCNKCGTSAPVTGTTHAHVHSSGHGLIQAGCHQNGQTYAQGETWHDGCDWTCTCTDAAAHRYQCRSRCPEWSLPPACSLIPPAEGKCCSVPSCPPGYTINYPPNYTVE